MILSTATAMHQQTEGAFTWQVPDGWQQGRGAWGGRVAAGVARAVEPVSYTHLRAHET